MLWISLRYTENSQETDSTIDTMDMDCKLSLRMFFFNLTCFGKLQSFLIYMFVELLGKIPSTIVEHEENLVTNGEFRFFNAIMVILDR